MTYINIIHDNDVKDNLACTNIKKDIYLYSKFTKCEILFFLQKLLI